MSSNLHLKVVVLAMVAFGLMLMGGSVSADPDPDCTKPIDDNHSAGPTLGEGKMSHCVHTVATVGGGSSNTPVVENKWELPDMDSGAAGIQYIDAAKGGIDPCVWNATNTLYINTPCIDENGNDIPNKNTLEHGHFHHDADPCKKGDSGCQLTVAPNVDDKPEKRAVEIWAVVSNDTGGIGAIANVQAIIHYDPNGEPVKKETNPTHPVAMVKQSCEDLFGPDVPETNPETNPQTPLHAAVNTGGLQHAKLIRDDCEQEEWAVYAGYFLLNNDQPWGKYGVCVQAIDTSSNLGDLCNKFLVQNVVAFKIDFSTVNFGAVSAGISKTVSPGNVTNTGNADACLSVLFGVMEGKVNQNIIDDFGAELKGQSANAPADSAVQFTTPIESKGVNKIRFTIDPPSPLAPDTYQGRVDLAVKKGPCTGS